MSIGALLPNFTPMSTPEGLRTMATSAEDLGYEHMWLGDHIIMPNQISSAYPYTSDYGSPFDPSQPIPEPLAMLCYLAGCTSRIRMGPFVLIVPYREPIFTAKIISTLDNVSGGRLILGVGVGWMEEEFKTLGLDTFHQRGKVTDEYLRIYKELWTKDVPEFQGEYSKFSGIRFEPKPVQKPHPPIWVGGNTRAALRRAATLGDGWMPVGLQPHTELEIEDMAKTITQLQDMTERAGRPRDAVDPVLAASVKFDPPRGGTRTTFTGSPEEIANDINLYQQVGVKHFVVAFGGEERDGGWTSSFLGDQVDQVVRNMERFARDVMPLVA